MKITPNVPNWPAQQRWLRFASTPAGAPQIEVPWVVADRNHAGWSGLGLVANCNHAPEPQGQRRP